MNKEKFSLRKRLKSFTYAFHGIGILIKNEHNAWIHLFAAVCVVIAGFVFQISVTEWSIVVLAIGTVLAAEAVNSAIEALSDLVSPGYHELIRKAKDLAAGAVLLVAIAAATVGLIIFIPRILTFLNY